MDLAAQLVDNDWDNMQMLGRQNRQARQLVSQLNKKRMKAPTLLQVDWASTSHPSKRKTRRDSQHNTDAQAVAKRRSRENVTSANSALLHLDPGGSFFAPHQMGQNVGGFIVKKFTWCAFRRLSLFGLSWSEDSTLVAVTIVVMKYFHHRF